MKTLESISKGLKRAEEPPIQLGNQTASSSLIDDSTTCESLRRIVARITGDDPTLEDDAMQECRIRLWRLASEHPGQTKSWYLQSCRFHLQHWLTSGRSVDSRKRANGDRRITIDPANDQLPVDWYHTNGELIELVSAHDIVSTLASRLEPRERAVLRGLANGLVLREVAVELSLSYPTALKCRRRIAALASRLGISSPARSARSRWREREGNSIPVPLPSTTLQSRKTPIFQTVVHDSFDPNRLSRNGCVSIRSPEILRISKLPDAGHQPFLSCFGLRAIGVEQAVPPRQIEPVWRGQNLHPDTVPEIPHRIEPNPLSS